MTMRELGSGCHSMADTKQYSPLHSLSHTVAMMENPTSRAAWNPAFLPNSQADIVSQTTYLQSSMQTEPPLFEAEKGEQNAPARDSISAEPLGKKEKKTWDAAHDSNGHPEIESLRDALTTSLSSPGGVEMAETPWHNEKSQPEIAENDKAAFPSEGPSYESKHLSSMSFARTVSEEVNWGEDDEVDPEWNLHRSDTDPFKFMAKSDRTNSFPVVPPAPLPGSSNEVPLPSSQAQEITSELEQEQKDLFGVEGDDPEGNFFSQTGEFPESPEAFLERAHVDQNGAHDYGQSYGGDIHAEDVEESEARFAEGLPLVHSVEHAEEYNESKVFTDFEENDTHDEEDLFARVSKADETQDAENAKPQLERKSTMQVMNSMNYMPAQPLHDKVIEEENMESSQGSLDRATGGGIGVSTSTELSQVCGGPDAAINDQSHSLASLELDSGEGDLAEKWKAALAGDEFLDDDEDGFLPDDDELPADSSAIDPSALFGSDDEGFLDDEDQSVFSPPVTAPVTGANGHPTGFNNLSNRATNTIRPSSSGSINRYLPAGGAPVQPPSSNIYAPSAPLLTDLSRSGNATAPPAPSPYMAAVSNFQPPQAQRPELPKAQSFVNSKVGYHSPYDLPMDVVKPPKKRVSMQQMNRPNAAPANIAPPRSSSMYSQPTPPPRASSASQSPPSSSHSMQQTQLSGQPTSPVKTVRKSQSGFFEELPMSVKPKLAPRHSSGLASAALNQYSQPAYPVAPPHGSMGLPMQHQMAPPPVHQGLVAPERVSPYAALPTGNAPPPPAVASRYSPAPPQPTSHMAPPPAGQSRYSPAPTLPRTQSSSAAPTQYSQPTPPLPHQPRTSSPLAHFERNLDSTRNHSFGSESSFDRRSSSSGHESNLRYQHLPPTREVDENESLSPPGKSYGELQNNYAQPMSPPSRGRGHTSQTPPPPQGFAARTVQSPTKRVNYAPQQHSNGPPPAFLPPKRSQTQSPGSAFAGPRLEMSNVEPYQRPASVELPASPRPAVGYPTSSRPRGFSQGVNYIAPTDGREQDPLQRWKGAPVFAWGVGGTIVTSFPKDVPRYTITSTTPMIVRSPGEVKVRNMKDMDPLSPRLTSFPGPLKGKSKKKDVLAWLSSGIAILEQNASYLRTAGTLTHDEKRSEERILLWKILGVLIEHDGTLEGSPAVEKAVRAVLSPGTDDESLSAPLYATGAELSGISPSATTPRADPVDPLAVDQLRKHLLRGEREKAVWEAVDKRLWAHAMLISNTVSQDLYKQVAQEFVQKEVKNIGDNTESLAALYEIFAGNFEESIDELVPPSARAGFQMVSTANVSGPPKGALDGLDRWRETLGLVLSNRSNGDTRALKALGSLLSGYGRAEAAHICFLFARDLQLFGGLDNPQTSIILVGSDQLRQPYDFDREMEPILLSEVFEYGQSLAAPPAALVTASPHLSIYKLQHAKTLAEYGYRDKALQYCDTIESTISSHTSRSPYHHALLASELADLRARLKQSPKDDSGSWISKPSIDKAKGSVWATFNKFVSGDGEEEAGAGRTGGASDVGPFARIAGGTPTISRSPSNADFGSYSNGTAAMPITKANSRYAPVDSFSTMNHESQFATSYGSQPRSSFEERSSGEFRRREPVRQMSDYRPGSQMSASNPYAPQPGSNYTPQSSYTPQAGPASSYEPSPYAPQTPATENASPNIFSSPQAISTFDSPRTNSYTPPEATVHQPQSSSYEAPANSYGPPSEAYEPFAPSSYEPPTVISYESPASDGYELPSVGGYEPPSGSYEPPSYQPGTVDESDSPIDTRPKKKSFMDDDNDDMPAPREKTKAEKDREADEAFRKAAEADGKEPFL